jgi:hypothetical protein
VRITIEIQERELPDYSQRETGLEEALTITLEEYDLTVRDVKYTTGLLRELNQT